jgi:hypothetical protein
MATKKKRTNSAPTEPTTKTGTTKRVKTETALVEDSPRTEPGRAEAAVTPSALTSELHPTGSPMVDETEDIAQAQTTVETADTAQAPTPAEPTPRANKLCALDAAVKVLGETDRAMNCQELIAAMAARGYWRSPKGRTPASTLYASILRELQTKGVHARFRKTERGKFRLKGAV